MTKLNQTKTPIAGEVKSLPTTNDASYCSDDDDLMPILVQKGLVPVVDEDMHVRVGRQPSSSSLKCQAKGSRKLFKPTIPKEPASFQTKAPRVLPYLDDVSSSEIGDSYMTRPTDEEEGHSHTVVPGSLSRGRDVNSMSTPGAYAAFPGSQERRQSRLDTSLMTTTNLRELPSLNIGGANNPLGLAEATPVNEETSRGLPDATRVDPETLEIKQRREERRQKLGCMTVCLFMAVILATTLVYFLSNRSSTPPPRVPLQQLPTESPTINSSMVSSANDTLSWVGTLPPSTQDALLDPWSPQSKALHWLSDHPNMTSMQDWRLVQLFGLATVFHALHGEQWPQVIQDDWMDYTRSECDWYSDIFTWVYYNMMLGKYWLAGIKTNETTCNAMSVLTRLSIMLVGQKSDPARSPDILPPEIALLKDLEQISLKTMVANGPISNFIIPELSQLRQLRKLRLGSDTLTGTVPSSMFDTLTQLPSLEEFEIEKSALAGTLPSGFSQLSNLKVFRLHSICASGCSEWLGIDFKDAPQMSGTIPDQWFQLSHLEEFSLNSFNVTGSIPEALGQWSNLSELTITCRLTGTIPSSVAKLTRLTILNLRGNPSQGNPSQGNKLTGRIPPELGHASGLKILDLSYNDFSGPIPPSLLSAMRQVNAAVSLSLTDNSLSGIVPSDLWFLTTLSSIELGGNRALEGKIPEAQIGSLQSLVKLNLGNNAFHGTIPFQEMKPLSELKILQLQENNFTGSIASEIGLLTSLFHVDLADNQFLSGTIPTEIAGCISLSHLLLQGNQFSGHIPSELGKLGYIRELNVSNNMLSGQIPSELGILEWLQKLALAATHLSGSVPEEVCTLKTDARLQEIQVDCSMVACDCNCTCV